MSITQETLCQRHIYTVLIAIIPRSPHNPCTQKIPWCSNDKWENEETDYTQFFGVFCCLSINEASAKTKCETYILHVTTTPEWSDASLSKKKNPTWFVLTWKILQGINTSSNKQHCVGSFNALTLCNSWLQVSPEQQTEFQLKSQGVLIVLRSYILSCLFLYTVWGCMSRLQQITAPKCIATQLVVEFICLRLSSEILSHDACTDKWLKCCCLCAKNRSHRMKGSQRCLMWKCKSCVRTSLVGYWLPFSCICTLLPTSLYHKCTRLNVKCLNNSSKSRKHSRKMGKKGEIRKHKPYQ